MATSKKRPRVKEPAKKEDGKRARMDSGTNVIIRDVSSSVPCSSTSSATTAVASFSSTAGATAAQKLASLSDSITVTEGAFNGVKSLKKIESANKEDGMFSHPVIIRSCTSTF